MVSNAAISRVFNVLHSYCIDPKEFVWDEEDEVRAAPVVQKPASPEPIVTKTGPIVAIPAPCETSAPKPHVPSEPGIADPEVKSLVASPVINEGEARKFWEASFRRGLLGTYEFAHGRARHFKMMGDRNPETGRVLIQYVTPEGETIGEPVNVPAKYEKRGKWHFIGYSKFPDLPL